MDGPRSTRVEIFGTEYNVRADAEPDYVNKIAAYVDAKMKEIAETQNLVSSTKVAILAAINIADEAFQERQRHDKTQDDVTTRALELAEVLEREL